MHFRLSFLGVLASFALVACSDSSDGGSPAATGGAPGSGGDAAGTGGSANGSGGTPGGTGGAHPGTGGDAAGTGGSANGSGGTDGDGGVWDTRAVLSRDAADTYECSVSLDRTGYPKHYWASQALATTTAGSAFSARIEVTGDNPYDPSPPKLLLTKLGLDGKFGTDVTLSTADTAGAVDIAPLAEGTAIVWVEGATLRFATADKDGKVVIPPKDLPSGAVDISSSTQLTATPDGGLAILYTTSTLDDPAAALRFLLVDAQGNQKHAYYPVTTLPASGYGGIMKAVATDDGYAIVWAEGDTSGGGKVYFSSRDAAGAPIVTRRQLSVDAPDTAAGTQGGFSHPSLGLFTVDGGYLAAWTERKGGSGLETSGATTAIRLAPIDENGAPRHPSVLLREPTLDIDEVEPDLVRFGDAIAVVWARGAHIYICGGCMPDHRIDLVLIDPETLNPLSALATVNPRDQAKTPGGGLTSRDDTVVGDSILMTFLQQYHTSSDSGAAAFTCHSR
jgi:hypothetical protein